MQAATDHIKTAETCHERSKECQEALSQQKLDVDESIASFDSLATSAFRALEDQKLKENWQSYYAGIVDAIIRSVLKN